MDPLHVRLPSPVELPVDEIPVDASQELSDPWMDGGLRKNGR